MQTPLISLTIKEGKKEMKWKKLFIQSSPLQSLIWEQLLFSPLKNCGFLLRAPLGLFSHYSPFFTFVSSTKT